MQSWRRTVAAAAVMTLHALALSAMAPSSAQGSTVYRCTGPQGRISYQAQPCAVDTADRPALHPPHQQQIKVADARTEDQLRQALDNRRREGFDTPVTNASKTASRRTKNKKASAASQQAHARTTDAAPPHKPRGHARSGRSSREPSAPRAGALTSHRLGERPFEHVRTPLSDAVAPRRRPSQDRHQHERKKDFTARAPAEAPQNRVRSRN